MAGMGWRRGWIRKLPSWKAGLTLHARMEKERSWANSTGRATEQAGRGPLKRWWEPAGPPQKRETRNTVRLFISFS
ncbi:uncharacterized protein VTP21DRAFT_11257 [Calcarisporiella thermophila]|uniref:uncharacterized protein n=1 Tax=Calcarisporiella thermophila TaxID=911321 RepID=UPI0037432C18